MSASPKHLYFDVRAQASAEGLVAALLHFSNGEAKMREALDAANLFGAGPQLKEAKRDRTLGRLLLWVDEKGLPLSLVLPDPRRRGAGTISSSSAEGSSSARRKRSQQSKKDFRRRDIEVVSIVEQDADNEKDANVLHLSRDETKERSLQKADQQRPENAKGRIRAWLNNDDVGSAELKAHLQESRLSPLTKMVAMKALCHWLRSLSQACGVSTTDVALPGREALRGLFNFVAFAALLEEQAPKSVQCSSLPRGPSLRLNAFSDELFEHWSLTAAPPLFLQGKALFGIDPVAASLLNAVCRENRALPAHQVKGVARGGCSAQPYGWVWLQALHFQVAACEELCVRALLEQGPNHLQQQRLTQDLLQAGAFYTTLSTVSKGTQIEVVAEKEHFQAVVAALLKWGASAVFSFGVQSPQPPQLQEVSHTVVVGSGKAKQNVRVVTRTWNREEVYRQVLAEDVMRASEASGFSPTSIEEEALMMFQKITSSTTEEQKP